jgi:nucleotide-binding universal stress UspA family protein
VSDLDRYRSQQEAHRASAGRTTTTPYREAVNRYLGAVAYGSDEPDRPTATTSPTPGPVVVGVDDTPTTYTAVDHAAIEAELRGCGLRLVHVQQPGGLRSPTREAGARLLQRLTDRVHAYSPSVPVTSRLEVGGAAALVLAQAQTASLVVVGHRHSTVGTAFGLSVADRVAAGHAGVVLVVRVPGWPPGPEFGSRPIVVGADHDDSIAVWFALDEARVRGCDLVILHAGHDIAPPTLLDTDGVPVGHVNVTGGPVDALIGASRNASAIVVGRRRVGRTTGLTLGSVSRTLVQYAHCPIFLVG